MTEQEWQVRSMSSAEGGSNPQVPEVEEPNHGAGPRGSEDDSTNRTSPSRKRVLTIVRRRPKPLDAGSKGHVYLISRKPRDGEKLVPSPVHESLPPGYPLSPTEIIKRGPNGAIMKHSILGSIEDLQEVGGWVRWQARQDHGNHATSCSTSNSSSTRESLEPLWLHWCQPVLLPSQMETIMNEEDDGDGEEEEEVREVEPLDASAGGGTGSSNNYAQRPAQRDSSPKSMRSQASRSLGRKSTRLSSMMGVPEGDEDGGAPDPFVDRNRYIRALTDMLAKARTTRMQEEKTEKVRPGRQAGGR